MKSHYSILSAMVRPEVQEKITIGLLLVSANGLYFLCSKNKLSVVRSLIDKSLYRYLADSIRQIEQAIEKEQASKGSLFVHSAHDLQFSAGYLEYMSRYSNNLIQFSTPTQIDVEGSDQLLGRLFSKYVDGAELPRKRTKSVEAIKADFIPQVKTFYNTEQEVSVNDLPNLLMPVNVDMIGENKVPVFGQFVDFERHINYIQQDVAVLNFLQSAFVDRSPKSFLIAAEPDRVAYPKSHDAWNSIRRWKDTEYVPLDEADRVRLYAEEHGVHPLFHPN